MENAAAMIPAIVALMLSPGPVTLTSAAFGAAYGRRATRMVLIMTSGTATVIVLVALGVFGLVTLVPGIEPMLMGLGGLYILYLAWKIWNAPPVQARQVDIAMPAAIGHHSLPPGRLDRYADLWRPGVCGYLSNARSF